MSMTPEDHIMAGFARFETMKSVVVEYGIISGSRDFGYEKATSDYDVGFVYSGAWDPGGGSLSDYYETKYVAYRGYHIDIFYVMLDCGDQWGWDMIASKKVIINKNDFQKNAIANYPYRKSDLLRSYYYNALSRYRVSVLDPADPKISGYLTVINAIMRYRWIEANDTIDFPEVRDLTYLSGKVLTEAQNLLVIPSGIIARQPALDIYILGELQSMKMDLGVP